LILSRWPFGRRSNAPGPFEREALCVANEVWDLADEELRHRVSGWSMMERSFYPEIQRVEAEGPSRLKRRLPEDKLGAMAVDVLFHPEEMRRRYGSDRWGGPETRFWAVLRLAGACVAESPPPDLVRRIERRIETLRSLERPLPPVQHHCFLLLSKVPTMPGTLEFARKYLWGDGALIPSNSRTQLGLASTLMRMLHERDRISYEDFVRALEKTPQVLWSAGRAFSHGDEDVSRPGYREMLLSYHRRFVEEFAAQPLGRPGSHLMAIGGVEGLRGDPGLLIAAAKLFSQEETAPILPFAYSARWYGGPPVEFSSWVAGKLAYYAAAGAPGERKRVVESLRSFPREKLLMMLPSACRPATAGMIARALGGDWERAAPLIETLVETARLYDQRGWGRIQEDIHRNDPDPTLGVLDAGAARRALNLAGQEMRNRVFDLYRETGLKIENSIRLLEVTEGHHRSWIEEGFEKRNHQAVKALGLLPIEGGIEEVRRQFGSQRRATEGAAAAAALTNLALNAGYSDTTRLTWAMQAGEVSGEAKKTAWRVGDYEAELLFEAAQPRVVYRRLGENSRELKSAPKAVKESAQYADIKSALARVKRDTAMMRATLEGIMAGEEGLYPDDVRTLQALPTGRMFLEALILMDEDGFLGLFEPGVPPTLRGLPDSGKREVSGALRIAHPRHLYVAQRLSGWQREVVRRRISQPFKQAFRELYVLTPAERESRTRSARFDGHEVDSRTTARLLESRGWDIPKDEVSWPTKLFRSAGISAVFEMETGRYFTEEETVSTGGISFYLSGRRGPSGEVLPLEGVPPVVFSEVMRDADLVVSVAQASSEGAARLSAEGYERRGELLTALVEDLGIEGISVEGRFARVRGRLASYRVHLGSGAIHIEPGNYLCIVPAEKSRGRRVFLPFAGETAVDGKAREIVSKVLMLVNDHRIKDQTILGQIEDAIRTRN
jgi:hypothetical protein